MLYEFGKQFKIQLQQLDRKYFPTHSSKYKGFTLDEIEIVRQAQQVDYLPVIYRQFLHTMGHQRGNAFRVCAEGCGYFKELRNFKNTLCNILMYEHGTRLELPDNAFVFYIDSWGGENSFFFQAHMGEDNPPVYYYHEGNINFVKAAESLSQWFTEQAIYEEDLQLKGPLYWLRMHLADELKKVYPLNADYIDSKDDNIPF